MDRSHNDIRPPVLTSIEIERMTHIMESALSIISVSKSFPGFRS